jgi:hypothetical protein
VAIPSTFTPPPLLHTPHSHSPTTGTKPEIVEAAYNSFLAEDCGAVVDGHPKCDDHDFAGTCMKYFLIIESHHDYCGPNDLPKDVEVGWHDLEDLGCHSCSITRQHNSALKDCPIVDCTDLGVLGAAWSVIEAGCEAGATGGGHDHAHRRLSGDDEGSAYEWSGAFAVDDATHVWNMQKVDGAYADLTMKLVLIPTSTTPDEATMHSLEETGETLIEGTCTVIEAGETMTPLTDGSCFELHVDADADDSSFTIATSGIAGLVMFAQHVPTEFERTMHYLKDSAGVDIEAIAEEIAGTVACCETADQIGAWKVALAYHDFCGWELLPEKVRCAYVAPPPRPHPTPASSSCSPRRSRKESTTSRASASTTAATRFAPATRTRPSVCRRRRRRTAMTTLNSPSLWPPSSACLSSSALASSGRLRPRTTLCPWIMLASSPMRRGTRLASRREKK